MEPLNRNEKHQSRIKRLVKAVLTTCFRIEIKGEYKPTPNSLIIANNTSVIDMLLLSVFLPERLTIVLHPRVAKKAWVKLLTIFCEVIAINPAYSSATRVLIKEIKAGKRCVILPQSLLDEQEDSLKIFDGPGLIIRKTQADIIPVRIDGAQHSIFALDKGKTRIRLFPKITLHIAPPEVFAQTNLKSVDKEAVNLRLFRLISSMEFANSFQPQTLFTALIQGVDRGSKNQAKIEDSNRTPLTYRQFIARSFILGRQIKEQTKMGEYVGVMMPTTTAGLVTFFALQAYRRIPAMLNFSMGFYNLFSACTTAGIKTIYTSKQFIATAKLEPLIDELQGAGIKVRFLEEFKSTINLGNKISGLIKGLFPALAYSLLGEKVSPQQTGLVLFTSGSEGIPKGVALSHANILANCYQMLSRVDFNSSDVFFNSLPIFHCFGLTAGSVVPLIVGMNCFFYPSPLHYKIIPGLVQQTGATIMFGTDTFLTGYARAAERSDFKSIRYIFAGAEKVKPETQKYWLEHFGVTVYEGYGATEASPVISLNCPYASSPGSVGMILPAMEYRIDPVEGIAQGGRLLLRGPNIMLGYLNKDAAGSYTPPKDGWHDTGDIVTLDSDGFITIAGRAKRFAKIAGEMISLTAVESIASSIWPELLNAAMAQKCAKKGEQILLFTEAAHADKSTFIKKIHEQGYSDLLVPYQIYPDSKIPVLPSGKIDYLTLDKALGDVKKSEALSLVADG